MARQGKEFEEAVLAFVQTLDPEAKIYFDHKVPDRDTGTLRQVDVWIEAKVLNHYPQTIAISCKDHKRRVNVSQIGTFVNEVRSVGASFGIIYSASGFSANALTKARANGISCCQLFRNTAPAVPDCLFLTFFIVTPKTSLEVCDRIGDLEHTCRWGDVFSLSVMSEKGSVKGLEFLAQGYAGLEETLLKQPRARNGIPPHGSTSCTLETANGANVSRITVRIRISWRIYRGRIEAHMLEGSYCFDNKDFQGRLFGPIVDLKGDSPGPGWEPASINDVTSATPILIGILHKPDFGKSFEGYADKPLA